MKITCPVCGFYAGLDGFLAADAYKQALAVLCALPPGVPQLAVCYLGLFRAPGSSRVLSGPRVLKLCTVLRELVSADTIQWKGRQAVKNNARFWQKALETVLAKQDKLDRPLANHNLLRAIAYDLALKEAEQPPSGVNAPSAPFGELCQGHVQGEGRQKEIWDEFKNQARVFLDHWKRREYEKGSK